MHRPGDATPIQLSGRGTGWMMMTILVRSASPVHPLFGKLVFAPSVPDPARR